ncbi:chitin binding [Pyrenophora seminiperda CCB06]|uniref:Chitin binding n=1 Tax=Pyrenophora seminiperda CCB06 TaxID=1302712 RepID=A0A3M7MB81_9PLEO|nr:chitin binding [Pyrenophora seminiperda CCB06]
MALKIRDYPSYNVKPAGIIQVEYNVEASKGKLWYDLSAIDCDPEAGPMNPNYCPFLAGGLKLSIPASPACTQATCSGGTCEKTYLTHESFLNEPTMNCGAGADLLLETCTDGPGEQTFGSKGSHPSVDPVSGPTPEPTGYNSGAELIVSPNGECGNGTNYTCDGSSFGLCCSPWNFCGSSWAYCSGECQLGYGFCLRGGFNGTEFATSSPAAGFGDVALHHARTLAANQTRTRTLETRSAVAEKRHEWKPWLTKTKLSTGTATATKAKRQDFARTTTYGWKRDEQLTLPTEAPFAVTTTALDKRVEAFQGSGYNKIYTGADPTWEWWNTTLTELQWPIAFWKRAERTSFTSLSTSISTSTSAPPTLTAAPAPLIKTDHGPMKRKDGIDKRPWNKKRSQGADKNWNLSHGTNMGMKDRVANKAGQHHASGVKKSHAQLMGQGWTDEEIEEVESILANRPDLQQRADTGRYLHNGFEKTHSVGYTENPKHTKSA